MQTNFRSLSGQLLKTTCLSLKRIYPHGQRHIANKTGFANAQKRLFATDNYGFYSHQNYLRHFGQSSDMVYGYKVSKEFSTGQTKSGVQL
jgi:hypothetical protein